MNKSKIVIITVFLMIIALFAGLFVRRNIKLKEIQAQQELHKLRIEEAKNRNHKDFKDVCWGDDKEIVSACESSPTSTNYLETDLKCSSYYEGEKATLYYRFDDNGGLVNAYYYLEDMPSSGYQMIDKFEAIKKTISSEYGKPARDTSELFGFKLSSKDPDVVYGLDHGKDGYMVEWDTDSDTRVILYMAPLTSYSINDPLGMPGTSPSIIVEYYDSSKIESSLSGHGIDIW